MLHNALTRYTSSGGIRRHLPLEGKAKSGRAARLAEQTRFAPNAETFSAVHFITVSYRSRLARSPGGSGGGAALSPGFQLNLCLPEQHGAHSRRSPLSVLSCRGVLCTSKECRKTRVTQSENLCRNPNPTDRLPLRPFVNCLTRFFTEL